MEKRNRGIFLTTMLVIAGFSSIINIINFIHPLYPGEVYVKSFYYLDFFNVFTVLAGAAGVVGAFYWRRWGIFSALAGPMCWQIAQIIYLQMFLMPVNYILTFLFDALFIWSFARKWQLFS